MQVIQVTLKSVIYALERAASNTDTDLRWIAAAELRKVFDWDSSLHVIEIKAEETK
jgi:hypothetical protein